MEDIHDDRNKPIAMFARSRVGVKTEYAEFFHLILCVDDGLWFGDTVDANYKNRSVLCRLWFSLDEYIKMRPAFLAQYCTGWSRIGMKGFWYIFKCDVMYEIYREEGLNQGNSSDWQLRHSSVSGFLFCYSECKWSVYGTVHMYAWCIVGARRFHHKLNCDFYMFPRRHTTSLKTWSRPPTRR